MSESGTTEHGREIWVLIESADGQVEEVPAPVPLGGLTDGCPESQVDPC